MQKQIESFFKLNENNTTIKIEFIAGLTTFMTMSYIILVEPTLLQKTGMDFGSVMVATCLSSAIGTLLMGLFANYPIALAAAMGHNFFFTFTVCGAISMGGLGFSWQAALAAVFVAGILYLLLTFSGIREMLLDLIPVSLKHGIAAGIGLSIVPEAIRDFWNKQIIYKTLHADTPCIAPIYAVYKQDFDHIRLSHILNLLK